MPVSPYKVLMSSNVVAAFHPYWEQEQHPLVTWSPTYHLKQRWRRRRRRRQRQLCLLLVLRGFGVPRQTSTTGPSSSPAPTPPVSITTNADSGTLHRDQHAVTFRKKYWISAIKRKTFLLFPRRIFLRDISSLHSSYYYTTTYTLCRRKERTNNVNTGTTGKQLTGYGERRKEKDDEPTDRQQLEWVHGA